MKKNKKSDNPKQKNDIESESKKGIDKKENMDDEFEQKNKSEDDSKSKMNKKKIPNSKAKNKKDDESEIESSDGLSEISSDDLINDIESKNSTIDLKSLPMLMENPLQLGELNKAKRGRPRKDSKKVLFGDVTDKKNVPHKNFKSKIIDITSGNPIFPMEKTSLCCWHCTYPFDNPPFFIPDKYSNSMQLFQVFGNFCSVNCAIAYNQSLKDARVLERYACIKTLYKKINQCDENECDKIIPAPQKEILDKYGGPYTIKQYRKNFNIKKISIISQPMVPITMRVEEI